VGKSRTKLKYLLVRAMGRIAPSTLRWMAYRNPLSRLRWPMLAALTGDEKCSGWLASLENPTKTRAGFRLYTVGGDLTSDWIKLHGLHEAATERFVRDHLKGGSTFVDVGSNIGYYSILAAVKLGAKVVAFEPQSSIADLLQQSADYNGVSSSVRVMRAALYDRTDVMRMTMLPGNTGGSRLVCLDAAGALPSPVPVIVFDDWHADNPMPSVSVCKIDTEGSELQVLRGMLRLIDRDAPAIVMEVVDECLAKYGSSGAAILDLLGGHGYIDVSANYAEADDRNRYFVAGPSVAKKTKGASR
jgi:FkbM family methyltransferase